jgi:hypothetical protein
MRPGTDRRAAALGPLHPRCHRIVDVHERHFADRAVEEVAVPPVGGTGTVSYQVADSNRGASLVGASDRDQLFGEIDAGYRRTTSCQFPGGASGSAGQIQPTLAFQLCRQHLRRRITDEARGVPDPGYVPFGDLVVASPWRPVRPVSPLLTALALRITLTCPTHLRNLPLLANKRACPRERREHGNHECRHVPHGDRRSFGSSSERS